MAKKIRLTSIVADTKQEALEQAFDTIKESAGLDEGLVLKDVLYDSIMNSLSVEQIMTLIQAIVVRLQFEQFEEELKNE